MWANMLKKGEYHLLHSHNEHTMSGAYYLQTPVNSGQIYFKDPRPQTNSWTQKFIDKGNINIKNISTRGCKKNFLIKAKNIKIFFCWVSQKCCQRL